MASTSSQRRRRRNTAGQSLVELALILPVFLLLLLTSLDLGRLMYSQIAITNAAKEGALVASQGGTFQTGAPCNTTTNTVMCGVLTEAKGGFVEVDQTRVDLQPAVCDDDAPYPATGSPPDVTVSVEAPFHVLTPIIGAFVGSDPTLSATAEAQCLAVPNVAFASLPPPTASPCPAVSFTATDTSNPGNPHRMRLAGAVAPSSSGWTWTWTGAITESGQNPQVNFSSSGNHTVTLTAAKDACTVSTTQTVTAP